MSVAVLRVAIDTLEVSYEGELFQGLSDQLDELKGLAQDQECPQRFGGTQLFMEPSSFRGWRWRLTCRDFSVVLSPQHGGQVVRPNAQIRFSAFGLSTREHLELLAEAKKSLKFLGVFREWNVSRLDVCADLQGWTPAQDEMLGMCCPAVYRGIHLAGRVPQTFQFGKGELLVRIYDKTAELVHSGKAWMGHVWRECAGYDESLPVIRVESQMRTKPLRELGFYTAGAVMRSGVASFEWALRWCQLRVPNGDKKVTRWPEHPVWEQLRAAVLSSKHCERARVASALLPLTTAAKRLPGLVALYAAHYGGCGYDEALGKLCVAAKASMISEQTDFAALVAEKSRRLEIVEGLPAKVPE